MSCAANRTILSIAANRDLVHKIGVTGGDVSTSPMPSWTRPSCWRTWRSWRPTSSTISVAPSWKTLIHRIFDPARLDIEIKDRFGNPVIPRGRFLVPLFVIDDAVEKIKDGTITGYVYDPKIARLVQRRKRSCSRGGNAG